MFIIRKNESDSEGLAPFAIWEYSQEQRSYSEPNMSPGTITKLDTCVLLPSQPEHIRSLPMHISDRARTVNEVVLSYSKLTHIILFSILANQHTSSNS